MSNQAPRIRTSRPAPSAKAKLTSGGKVGLTVLAVLLIGAVAVAAVMGWFLTRISTSYEGNTEVIADAFPEETERPQERTDKAKTILLLGSDTRGVLDQQDLDGPQDSRSDTIMLAHLPADEDAVYFVSVMRDAWVDIPGHGEAKINAAMAYGGVPLTVKVLEGMIGTRIDQVAAIDFTGFKDLTDALGGVTVTNTVAFEAQGFNFPLGDITLDGEEALAFVRARKPFADGDYQRVRNQQAFIKGVAKKLISSDTLTNPKRLIDVVDSISPFLAVSEGLNTEFILQTAASMRDMRSGDLYFITAPTGGVSTSADGQSIILLDPQGMEELRHAFETDTLGEYYASQE